MPNGVTPLFNLSNPFPQGVPAAYGNAAGLGIDLGQNITGPLQTQDIPYQANWSFDIQRQLPFNLVVTAAYVGNVGVHLYTPIQFNQIPDSDLAMGSKLISVVANPFYGVITDPSSTLSAATVQYGQLLRPFPQFLNVKAINVGAGHSSYEAGQLTVEKRFSQGLEVEMGYTKSKAIDNVGEQTSVAGSQSGFQDNYCFACDRALSDQNQPFAMRLAVRYELPFGPGKQMLITGSLPRCSAAGRLAASTRWMRDVRWRSPRPTTPVHLAAERESGPTRRVFRRRCQAVRRSAITALISTRRRSCRLRNISLAT